MKSKKRVTTAQEYNKLQLLHRKENISPPAKEKGGGKNCGQISFLNILKNHN